jgi:hypothetical protein
MDQPDEPGALGEKMELFQTVANSWMSHLNDRMNAAPTMDKQTFANLISKLKNDDLNVQHNNYFDNYIIKMRIDKEYGDDSTLLAVAALCKVDIMVFSSSDPDYVQIIAPPPHWNIKLSKRLFIGHANNHYVSAIPPKTSPT